MARAERQALIAKIERARRSKVVCYITSDRPQADAQIQKDVIPLIYEHLRKIGTVDRLDFFIFTNGGDTLAAFGLGRLAREFAKSVGTLIPGKCHSAGTLFALGSNEIVMTRLATMSPIDPSVTGPLNPAVEIAPGQRQLVALSVESVAGFKALVTEDWGVKGEDALSHALRILAERVHPLALGDVFRARQQIELLARKLLTSHRNDEEHVTRAIQVLTKQLGSHDYLIGRSEARELLGEQVAPDDDQVEDLMTELLLDFASEMQLGVPYNAGLELHAAKAASRPVPISVLHRLAVIETGRLRHSCEKELLVSELVVPTPMGPQTGIRQEEIRSGWLSDAAAPSTSAPTPPALTTSAPTPSASILVSPSP
jgi:hypothetical protein